MNTINRTLFGKETAQKNIIWGLRVDRNTKKSFQLAASLMRVPVNRLVSFVLLSWLRDNVDVFSDKGALRELSLVVNGNGTKKSAPKPLLGIPQRQLAIDDLAKLSATWTIRGVNVETRARIKVLALNRGISINQVLDDLVAREWKKVEDKPIEIRRPRILERGVRRLLQKASLSQRLK